MDYCLLIARRYLASRRRITMISVITGISVLGVSLGVAALIVVLSVMNGFYDVVRDLLVSVDPHLRIVSIEGGGINEDVRNIADLALSVPSVVEVSPYVEGKALLLHDSAAQTNRVVIVRGIDTTAAAAMKPVIGTSFLGQAPSGPGAVVGQSLARRLALEPGRQVALLSAPAIGQVLTSLFPAAPVARFEVRGLFQLEASYDNTHVFVDIGAARRLFRMQNRVSGIALRLADYRRAAEVKKELQARLHSPHLLVQTWYDQQRSLYEVMRLEKWGASLVLVLISVVAAFNIVGSLTMLVIEKRKDVGVLRTMGASRRRIRRIFLLEGALIGVLGTGLGFCAGLALCLLQEQFHFVPLLGAESFVIDSYPVAVRIFDLLGIAVVSFGLCLLASIYPASRAARIVPARAVHRTH